MDFSGNQGCINGQITKLANDKERVKEFMSDKTDKQKKAGRIHFKMIKFMSSKK